MKLKLPSLKTRVNLQAIGLVVAAILVISGPAIADTVEKRLDIVLGKIEAIVTKLTLDDSLDEQEMDTLRDNLASIYRELQDMKTEIAESNATPEPSIEEQPNLTTPSPKPVEPVVEEPSPTEEQNQSTEPVKPDQPVSDKTTQPESKTQWQTYAKAKAVITPPDAKFSGWRETADISFRWGEYGQIILEVANDEYHAQWTIDEAYNGNVNVSTQSQPEGSIVVQIEDERGHGEFLLQNGGLGPLHFRQTITNDPKPNTSTAQPTVIQISAPQTPPSLEGVWYRSYREQVASGNLAGSETLEWYITQYEVDEFKDCELAHLGDALRGLNGKARDSLGQLEYVNEGQHRSIIIPDPRINPVSFIQLINKVYWLHTSSIEYKFDIA